MNRLAAGFLRIRGHLPHPFLSADCSLGLPTRIRDRAGISRVFDEDRNPTKIVNTTSTV